MDTVTGSTVLSTTTLQGPCQGSVRRTSLRRLRLEAYQPIRRSGSHLGEGAVASRKEEADGEDEVGEKTQNFGTRQWGEA